MKQLTHLRHSDKFTDLIVSEIIKSLPWEVFLLNLLNNLLRNFSELSERAHRLPPNNMTRNKV